eukprot:scaffold25190_cov99-Amphora_coffeaeformis.AAC.1
MQEMRDLYAKHIANPKKQGQASRCTSQGVDWQQTCDQQAGKLVVETTKRPGGEPTSRAKSRA